MLTIDTEKLLNEIEQSPINELDSIVEKYAIDQIEPHLILDSIVKKSGMSKAAIGKQLGGTNYIYELCNGKKHPTRDKLIEIFLIIGTSLSQIQVTLQVFGHSKLYPKMQRDLYILRCIQTGKDLLEINQILVEKNLAPLSE